MYRFDSYDQSLVIDGFEKGIADNPYNGLADMRNMNIISVPGEGSVNFATAKISATAFSGTMTTTSASADTVTLSASPEDGQAIIFSVLSDITKGLTLVNADGSPTVYWLKTGSGGVYTLQSSYNPGSATVNITGDGVTGTWATVNMAKPKAFTSTTDGNTWMVDASGYVWSNARMTTTNSFWTFTGNAINSFSNGNGIVAYTASDGTGYIFVYSNSSIDYTLSLESGVAWNYQWNPGLGTVGVWSNTPSSRLKTSNAVSNSHQALWAPDGTVYFCDGNWVNSFVQTDPTIAFVPTTIATYVFAQFLLLPIDTAQCLTFLGSNILIGGIKNIIYVWDTTSVLPSSVILIPEFNVQQLVTVNTNTFIFVGTRGRIYVTNGTNAQLYKKIPDHISGTVEPYYNWGGATSTKNQLYFGVNAITNKTGTAINQYGGVWAIDLDTQAIRLTNKLSYGTYAGLVTAVIPNFGTDPAGTGLYIGWQDGAGNFGVDTTIGDPYTGSQATVDSDLIPIGTYNKPRNFTQIEYRLTQPLVSGESITIKTRLIFNTQDTGYTTTLTDSSAGNYSNTGPINFQNAQWVQFQIVLNSTATNPSFNRLKEIRILGLVGPTLAQNQSLSL